MTVPRAKGSSTGNADSFVPLLPLDQLVLKTLPKEGALIAGVYPDAKHVRDVQRDVADGKLPIDLLSTRLRVLGYFDLVRAMKVPKSTTQGYQITKAGERFLLSLEGESDGGPAE